MLAAATRDRGIAGGWQHGTYVSADNAHAASGDGAFHERGDQVLAAAGNDDSVIDSPLIFCAHANIILAATFTRNLRRRAATCALKVLITTADSGVLWISMVNACRLVDIYLIAGAMMVVA